MRGCGAFGLALLLAGCAGMPWGADDAAPRPGSPSAVAPTAGAAPAAESMAEQVAEGVYLVRGAAGETDPANRGRLGNAGFIVGPQGVIAIDAGVSYRQGRDLLAAIARVTDQPVRLLLITHVRQEFLFGAAAFQERGVPVAMHRAASQLMAARCETCLKTLVRLLGEEEMRGTRMFKPDEVFDGSHAYNLIGRPVTVHYFAHSSGPGDIAVQDDRTGVVFAGGLADAGRIPDVQDSRLPGWHEALAGLRALPIRVLVPGHGPAGAPAALLDGVARYLDQLRDKADRFVRQGMALSEVAEALSLPEYAGWDQYDNIHRRNASIVFLRLERDHLINPD